MKCSMNRPLAGGEMERKDNTKLKVTRGVGLVFWILIHILM